MNWVNIDQRMLAKISDLGAGICIVRELHVCECYHRLTIAAFTFDSPPAADECTTPAALRAPEILLRCRIDQKIDIWAFGCLIYELLTGQLLFQVTGLSAILQEQNDDDHLLQMVATLGHPPPEIFAEWPRRDRYFDENSRLIRSDVSSPDVADGESFQGPSLEEASKEPTPKGMTAEEVTQVLSLLRRILKYEPSGRPSTSDLLSDPWFQSIG
jgi:serine/threonine protein kinase